MAQQVKLTPSTSQALINERQAAELIGLSVAWLRRKRWSGGGIPFVKIGDGFKGAVRYRLEDVNNFLESRIRYSTSDAGSFER